MNVNVASMLQPLAALRRQRVVVSTMLILMLMGMVMLAGLATRLYFVDAAGCSSGWQPYRIQSGDTLSNLAASHGTSWQALQAANRMLIPNVNLIYVGEQLCLPHGSQANQQSSAPSALATSTLNTTVYNRSALYLTYNPYPQGQCTWWANYRYGQLHGAYVPWSANAGEWSQSASQFGWHVSTMPKVGDIVNLQPGVEGAGTLGHVAVVEQIYGTTNSGAISFNSSNYNWNGVSYAMTPVTFTSGPGVTFITR